MIVRRYGTWYHSVTPSFNPAAMTEIGFRRDHRHSIAADDFAGEYHLVEAGEVDAEADAPVQRDAERTLLANLERALDEWVDRLQSGQVLVVLNERDDWPKTRERREGVIVDGENRFYFHWWVDPVLKVGVYASGEHGGQSTL